MNQRIKFAIIDFDDTLSLTEAATFQMENDIAKVLGFPAMARKTHIDTWGMILEEALKIRFPGVDSGVFMKKLEEMMPEYIKSGKIDYIPDKNYITLQKILDKGLSIAILTSRTYVEIKHFLDVEHLLNKYMKYIHYKGSTKFHKPNPEVFNELCEIHKVSLDEIVYVGDSVSDAKCTKKAGVTFIACLESGLRKRADFAQFDVKYFIEDFSELDKVILRMNRN